MSENKVPILSPTAQAMMGVADDLAAVMSRIYHQSRFHHDGFDVNTTGKLQELQRTIEKYSADDPCVRAIAAWEAHLAESTAALQHENYAPAACEAFWHEAQRLQREFDAAVEATSQ